VIVSSLETIETMLHIDHPDSSIIWGSSGFRVGSVTV